MDDVGELVGSRYRIEHKLGQGAMGSVWLAQDTMLSRPVAVKILRREVAWRAMSRTRFEREAKLAAQIRSRHVVQVLDHGSHDGLPFLVMEYLEGESLRERLKRVTRLDVEQTAVVVKHVCRALARAHDVGLVHRDIKPDNLFVCRGEDDDEPVVKILDFGIAKLPDELAIDSEVATRTGALVGTPFYVSPEQARGLKSVGAASDLWSLGIVVFECLTGGRPFSAAGMGPLIAKILHAPIPRLSQVVPGLRFAPEVQDWLDRALQREPAERFSSARAMSEAFVIAAGVTDSQQPAGPRASLAPDSDATAIYVPSVEASTTIDATVALDDAALVAPSVDARSDDGAQTVALDPDVAPPPEAGPAWALRRSRDSGATAAPPARPAPTWRAPVIGIAIGLLAGLTGVAWIQLERAPRRLTPSFPVVRVTEGDDRAVATPDGSSSAHELSSPAPDDSR